MENFDNRIKLEAFKNETTYQNSYKIFPLSKIKDKKSQRTILDASSAKQSKPPPPYTFQDHETFIKWRHEPYIPINLLWKRKEIISTNPHEPFTKHAIPQDIEKANVIRTRPRVYMSPAVSMDDIPDENVRDLLCDFMYTTDWNKATKESKVQVREKDVPNCTAEIAGDPVTHARLKIDIMPPLPAIFRNKGIKWEDAQERASVDPTRTFWEHKDPPVKCGACINPVEGLVPEKTKQEIRKLLSEDRLRLAHDYPIPGYAGYRPRLSYGVTLAKTDLPVVHPLLSVTQAITKRYEKQKTQ